MNWELRALRFKKFLLINPINKFEILLIVRGENHWHLQHRNHAQKSKENREGQVEGGNRASGIPRRR